MRPFSASTGWTEETARQWLQRDVMGDLLALPRRIAVAVVGQDGTDVSAVLDVASGPGAFLEVALDELPDATGVWTDASTTMLEEARLSLARFGDRVDYRPADMVQLDSVTRAAEFDLVTTSRATHHLGTEELAGLYSTLASRLRPGGWLANIDHVRLAEPWEGRLRAARARLTGRTDTGRSHPHTRPLPTLDEHLPALRTAGFIEPQVAWSAFYSVLLMARKPS